MTTSFSLPDDLYLGEYESPFQTPAQLVTFIFLKENDCLAYKVLRMHLLDYASSSRPNRMDWSAITRDLRRYPELPHLSLAARGLFPVFRAGKVYLKGKST
jgi:hypothetical protein